MTGPALTSAERAAMSATADLWDLLCREVVDQGPSRDADLAELAAHLHSIQRAVLAQAAARAYPERYRLLGGEPPGVDDQGRVRL